MRALALDGVVRRSSNYDLPPSSPFSRLCQPTSIALIKSLLLILLLFVIGLFVLWLVVARPIIANGAAPRAGVSVDPRHLREQVEVLSKQFVPRDADHPEMLLKAADHIATEFRSKGARVGYQEFEVDYIRYKNVIAEYGPETLDVVVIGAHYDTAGDQPGAHDNASGVAGLLELGRLLSGVKLRSKVLLAAYVLEEPPHFRTGDMGSHAHAKSLRERGASVKLINDRIFLREGEQSRFPDAVAKTILPEPWELHSGGRSLVFQSRSGNKKMDERSQ